MLLWLCGVLFEVLVVGLLLFFGSLVVFVLNFPSFPKEPLNRKKREHTLVFIEGDIAALYDTRVVSC